jgi:hypothetical protein
MAREILGGFGPNSSQPQAPVASSGGVMPGDTKDVRRYAEPQGPKGIMGSQSPGLNGVNSGNTNQPTRVQSSGSPGLGGTNHGCCGSQGKY